jgi:transcriptional regulator with XRE-family HTH domain
MPSKKSSFAKFIRERRAELGLTGPELAARIGVSKSNVSYWENDSGMPNLAVLGRLADGLQVDYEDLLAVTGQHLSGLPTFAPYLRAKYGELPDKAVAEAEDFFNELRQRYTKDEHDKPGH